VHAKIENADDVGMAHFADELSLDVKPAPGLVVLSAYCEDLERSLSLQGGLGDQIDLSCSTRAKGL
jgi:hypothetical protein